VHPGNIGTPLEYEYFKVANTNQAQVFSLDAAISLPQVWPAAVVGMRQPVKQTYDLKRYFFRTVPELSRGSPVELIECLALPASLPERVDPVHETCAGLVCPGGF
jgi:hypothetical protein